MNLFDISLASKFSPGSSTHTEKTFDRHVEIHDPNSNWLIDTQSTESSNSTIAQKSQPEKLASEELSEFELPTVIEDSELNMTVSENFRKATQLVDTVSEKSGMTANSFSFDDNQLDSASQQSLDFNFEETKIEMKDNSERKFPNTEMTLTEIPETQSDENDDAFMRKTEESWKPDYYVESSDSTEKLSRVSTEQLLSESNILSEKISTNNRTGITPKVEKLKIDQLGSPRSGYNSPSTGKRKRVLRNSNRAEPGTPKSKRTTRSRKKREDIFI